MNTRWIVIFTLASALFCGEAFAMRVHLFDIDGTLVHDSGLNDEGKKPSWWTYWVLDRVSSVNNGWNIDHARKLIEAGALPERIYLNKNEVDRWRDQFSSRNERVGRLEPVELDYDPLRENLRPEIKNFRPRTIRPGYYRIEESYSYALHRDSDRGDSPLIESFRNAVARTKKNSDYEWRGRAFKFFANALARQSRDERIYFLTDRDHTERSYLDWVRAMHEMKFIPNPIKEETYTAASGELESLVIYPKSLSATALESRRFGSIYDFDSRKSAAVIDRAMNISRSPLPKTMVIGPDYNDARVGLFRPMHEFIIYENRPQYIREIVKTFKQNAAYLPNIKFVFYHAGELESVEALVPYLATSVDEDLRRWFVVTPSGTGLRHLTRVELNAIKGPSDCGQELSKTKEEIDK